MELHKEIIADVRENVNGIRSGHTHGGSEIAFATTDGGRVAKVERQVRQYIISKYDVRVQPASPSEVTPASGPAAPDFAFEIRGR